MWGWMFFIGLFEDFERVFDFELLSSFLHTTVDQAFSNLLLAVEHDAVDQALDRYAVVNAVGWISRTSEAVFLRGIWTSL